MPTIFRWNGYRFYFFSNEGHEPAHIHVDRIGNTAKIWLNSVSVASNRGFSDYALREICAKVTERRDEFLAAWEMFFI